MRKSTKIIVISAIAAMLLSLPASQAVVLWGIPSQFDETYYGELKDMHTRLQETTGKKIVIIGNSGVAFGIDSALMEQELHQADLNYSVCNFGLYISLGTKLMMDLSESSLKEGDIVLFMPELISQSLSLYFSGKETWYAMDSDSSIFAQLKSTDQKTVIGCASAYLGEKWGYYASGKKADSGKIYAHSSFDSHNDFLPGKRPYNSMDGLYDANNSLRFDASLYGSAFVDYVNSYAQTVKKKGASLYYAFAPMNRLSVSNQDPKTLSAFYEALSEKFSFPILNSPASSVMNENWFFDSNVHLNDSGMISHTLNLVSDIKNLFGNSTPNSTAMPIMPTVPPDDTPTGSGDDTDSDCFTYTLNDDSYTISALSESGKSRSELILPYSYQGKRVKRVDATTFLNDTALTRVTIQNNILSLPDGLFSGATQLRSILLKQTDPEALAVGYGLLTGTNSCTIYVPSASLSQYLNNYFWGHYASSIQTM